MKISPSIMCADLMNLGAALRAVEDAGADSIHIDVMDGHFVPGFTFGADIVRQMANASRLPLDVHLMTDDPFGQIRAFTDTNCATLTIHVEATPDIVRGLATVRGAGLRSGLAINPGTSIDTLDEVLPHADEVLVMAVCPGFVGQRQQPACLAKAARLVRRLRELGLPDVEVVVDGGVKPESVGPIAAAGVHKVVSGTGVFRPDMSIAQALALFRANSAVGAEPEGLQSAGAG